MKFIKSYMIDFEFIPKQMSNAYNNLNPIPPRRGVYFFKITPKRPLLRHWNFASFSSYLVEEFLKKLSVNDTTTSYIDVIAKKGGAKFKVKLSNWKKMKYL